MIIYLLLVTSYCSIHGQEKWTNIYYSDKSAYANYFIEEYDYGYLLVGRHGDSYPNYAWLIKTDINGQILWNKTIGLLDYYLVVTHIATNNQGSVYLAGGTTYLDVDNDPFILKLDSCGEKEWCKIISIPASNNFAESIVVTDDNGCAVLIYSSKDISQDRVCLYRFSSEGELMWQQCYNSLDAGIINQDCGSIIQTNDNGYLITGDCYYPDPLIPNTYWLKPYYIKVDSLGLFEWETVVHKDIGGAKGGAAWNTTINPSGTYYYSSISHSVSNYRAPALLVMDMDGNVVDIYDLNSGYSNGGLGYATFISDTTLAASASWGNNEIDHVGVAVIIDTLGNIIESETLVHDIYTIYMQDVYDNKLAFMYNTYQDDKFDVYLTKLNYDLEDDSIYTYPFQYDTLCPYPIASDTISQEGCNIIVGIAENEQFRNTDFGGLVFYPNPATSEIIMEIHDFEKYSHSSIDIYDLYGRKREEIILPKTQDNIRIDISLYPSGVYIAVLKDGNGIVAIGKFVKR